MGERFLITKGRGFPAVLLPKGTSRLEAAQTFEADVKAFDPFSREKNMRGNSAFRAFIEGNRDSIWWDSCRLAAAMETE